MRHGDSTPIHCLLCGTEGKVEPLLTADASHPGKLRSIGSQLNPAKHDDNTPNQGTIAVALGDLQYFKKQYLPA